MLRIEPWGGGQQGFSHTHTLRPALWCKCEVLWPGQQHDPGAHVDAFPLSPPLKVIKPVLPRVVRLQPLLWKALLLTAKGFPPRAILLLVKHWGKGAFRKTEAWQKTIIQLRNMLDQSLANMAISA